jgi:DNA-binding NtrC family response regulator
MIEIAVAGGKDVFGPEFMMALEKGGARITRLESGSDALAAVSAKTFHLLIADERLGDMTGLELVETVVTRQPMLNCAVVSSLSAEDYHEASEGLGILMQLSTAPGIKEADALVGHLKKIQSLKVGS